MVHINFKYLITVFVHHKVIHKLWVCDRLCGDLKFDCKLDICGRLCDDFVGYKNGPLFPVKVTWLWLEVIEEIRKMGANATAEGVNGRGHSLYSYAEFPGSWISFSFWYFWFYIWYCFVLCKYHINSKFDHASVSGCWPDIKISLCNPSD